MLNYQKLICANEEFNFTGPRVKKLNSNLGKECIRLFDTALTMAEYTDEQILAVYGNLASKDRLTTKKDK